jgi:16S rRNA (cytidine1402-2'-O)-methyltransferase
LTKRFEEIRRDTLGALARHYEEAGEPKGEIVVCVAPPGEQAPADIDIDALLMELAGSMSASKAAAEAARLTGEKKQALYQRLLVLRSADGA